MTITFKMLTFKFFTVHSNENKLILEKTRLDEFLNFTTLIGICKKESVKKWERVWQLVLKAFPSLQR